MLLPLGEWSRYLLVDGALLLPPDGADVAAIRVRERVRPVRSLARLRDVELRRASPRSGPFVRLPVEQLYTLEGELAGQTGFQLTIRVGRDRVPALHAVGAVYGDDCMWCVDARAQREENFQDLTARVRELLVHLHLGLGRKRVRRFLYSPPSGWEGLAYGLTTEWFPVGFPRRRAQIRVPPATPIELGIPPASEPVATALGLSGATRTRTAADGTLEIRAVVTDTEYVYLVDLETEPALAEETRATFLALVRSIVSLSRPAEPDQQMAALLYWGE